MAFDIKVDVDKLFPYDIYLVIYPMVCFSVSKIFGILDGLLMSGLVILEVMLILVYENLCGIYATLFLLVLSCVWINWSLDYEQGSM